MTRTPVERCAAVSRAVGLEVLVKRDDLGHPTHGGSKWRKLERILAEARAERATDLVTIGSAASNHVVATAVHAAALGVHAVLTPHPDSPSARAALRAMIALGAELHPARGDREVVAGVARLMGRLRLGGYRPYFIAPGGSSALGASTYMAAARELAHQLDGWPDLVGCALGSGGMHAGLAAGFAACGARAHLVGVKVRDGWATRERFVRWLAGRTLRLAGDRSRPLQIDIADAIGPGYGRPSEAGERALRLFAADGVALDSTYTAKAAAALLDIARARGARRVLFWHSFAPPPPARASIPPRLVELLTA
ncbi:MAG TPA: pyridoxal-phosphate dependent enzyme [Kofleriaceae bacterium]|nr:pyridoxal-phosphate dependent enzyme [Kofleriaceae bacterium]